ncbi:toxin-antitoxin system YwqK family antitoxin [Planctomicrobium piriforme]|uniref:MORN repeat variant n=1 Tax=Planctomicrobium piriforme TaxID=1576369 RepID=A0A1I3PZY9_9PLAN|nr:hypothetical protein [Planctomicrobium piriforme]SFJ27163.1 hypothetical protein SAMN05421753_11796 [Planctomicrobium piriforme]
MRSKTPMAVSILTLTILFAAALLVSHRIMTMPGTHATVPQHEELPDGGWRECVRLPDGSLHGEVKVFYTDGTLQGEFEYDAGQLLNGRLYRPDGTLHNVMSTDWLGRQVDETFDERGTRTN